MSAKTEVDRPRRRALAAIREGRVRLLGATPNWDHEFGEWRPSMYLLAQVFSTVPGRKPHEVRYRYGQWSCASCPREEDRCRHILAVALVTGHKLSSPGDP